MVWPRVRPHYLRRGLNCAAEKTFSAFILRSRYKPFEWHSMCTLDVQECSRNAIFKSNTMQLTSVGRLPLHSGASSVGC